LKLVIIPFMIPELCPFISWKMGNLWFSCYSFWVMPCML